MRHRLILCLALLATLAVYWPGLSGPFLFDDFWNLPPVELWYAGGQSWQLTLFPNDASALFSRPLAMATFMLTTWLGGLGPFPFKLGNLVIHLWCGLLAWWVLRRAVREDVGLAAHAELIATLAATLWLLHPLHVSTVLYAVQRMAQLSTLFTLSAVGVYLVARRQLVAGRFRPALANLFIFFPALVVAGLLSKQNAAVAPFLCLVFELAYFSKQAHHRKTVLAFFGLFALVPLLGAIALFAIAPERILSGYADWDFTAWQRLLTQPRALMDYIGMLLVPRGPLMGLETDDFPVSTDLLTPATTLVAILALVGLSAIAIALRKRAPSVFAGWFFFLVAHAVESSFLPLEMYYEHRNYLPSVGLLLAVLGLSPLVPDGIKTNVLSMRRLGLVAVSSFALVLCFATLGRVLVWQHEEGITAQGLKAHPHSLRANLNLLTQQLRANDFSGAALIPLLHSDNPRHRVVARLHSVVVGCLRGGADPRDLQLAVADALPTLSVAEVHVVRRLEKVNPHGECGAVTNEMMAESLTALLDAAVSQPDSAPTKYSVRMIATQLYARAGRWTDAEKNAEITWKASGHLPVAALLIRLYVHNGERTQALRLLGELESKVRPFDTAGQAEVARLHALLRLAPRPTGKADGKDARGVK